MFKDEGLSEEDKALFRQAVEDVTPLCAPSSKQTVPTPKKPSTLRSPCDYALSSYFVEIVQAETVLAFQRPGISKKSFQQLKRGTIRIEGRLDLHGYMPDEAQRILCVFLEQQQALNHRHVLIIHGKGGQHGEAPVMKNSVYCWLPQLPQILAFQSALPKHGGTGALYVLLKKASS